MSYNENNDFVDNIQKKNEAAKPALIRIIENIDLLVMFPINIGLLQTFQADLVSKYNGAFMFIIGIMALAFVSYGPKLAAGYYVQGKKYFENFVFYGNRCVRKEIECINEPLVVAALDDDDTLLTLDDTDKEYKKLFSLLGIDFLNDENINDKIDKAIIDRYANRTDKIVKVKSKNKNILYGIIILLVTISAIALILLKIFEVI